MNLLDTLSLLLRRWWMVLAIGIVVALAALIVQETRPAVYVAETTIVVSRVNRSNTQDYQYDNYYSVQAAELVANSAERFYESGDFAQAVAARSEMEVSDDDALAFARRFKVKQVSSHILEVQVTAPSREEAQKMLDASSEELADRIATVEAAEPRSGKDAAAFSATPTDSIVYERTYPQGVVLGAGFVAGLFLGLALIVLQAALNMHDGAHSDHRR